MRRHFGAVIVFLATLLLLCGGCTALTGEGFALYLTRDDVPPDRMGALSHVELAGRPIISLKDIVSYNAGTHEMALSDGAYQRMSDLEVPVRGRSFLVCVDREPLYWGALWTAFSSVSFDGVVILQPLRPEGPKVIGLELGYPSESFYRGADPRSDAAALKSLERAGKLRKSGG